MKRRYYRTAALLHAQPRPIGRRLPRVHLSRTTVALLGVLLALALWLWLDNRWYLMGTDLHIEGATTAETAQEVALASDLLGWHGLWLRPAQAEAHILQQIPAVSTADVSCHRYPAACVVQIVEREPVLVWQTGQATYGVDAEGEFFPLRHPPGTLPVIQGALPQGTTAKIPAAILDGAQSLRDRSPDITTLGYLPQRGLVWVDPQGRRVAFGTGKEMATRWQVYRALIANLDARGVFPQTVDVQFPAAPTYSLGLAW